MANYSVWFFLSRRRYRKSPVVEIRHDKKCAIVDIRDEKKKGATLDMRCNKKIDIVEISAIVDLRHDKKSAMVDISRETEKLY